MDGTIVKGMKAEEIFKKLKLKEHTLYKVIVKHFKSNPAHYSYLFTGFKCGSYCKIYSTNSGETDMRQVYYLEIVKKLDYFGKIETIKDTFIFD